MSVEQDKYLFGKLKGGSRKAFNQIFSKHYSRLCNFARGIVKNSDAAEEIVQEVFIHIWEIRDRIDVEKSAIAFLYTCVRNHSYNKIEREKTRKNYEQRYVEGLQTVMQDEKEFVPAAMSVAVILKKAIATLPEKCREIFIMSRYEGLTYDEISQYLAISEKTVENQMGIAFKKLRAFLVPRYENVLFK